MPLIRSRMPVCLLVMTAGAAMASESATVIGPSNQPLADGATALMAGDPEEGVRLTLRGLERATSNRDRVAAWANLCAGYAMLNRLEDALAWCNEAIDHDADNWRALSNRALVYVLRRDFDRAAADVARAEAIAPQARVLRQVKFMLQNAVDPVVPTVIVDDRRRPPDPAEPR